MTEGNQHTVTAVESRTRRVYTGRVELVAEPAPATPRLERLRRNVADLPVLMLLAAACLAQVADAVTTAIGLQRSGRFEANFLMRLAVTQPVTVGVLKVLLVVLICVLALLRLPTRRARVALLLAFCLSVIAPIQNLFQIFGS